MEHTRGDLVHGHCRDRPRTLRQADALKTWGRAYWKAIHPFNLEGGYVNFMMDDEVRGAHPSELRRELQSPRVCESEVRSGKPLSGQPEHRPGRLLTGVP